MSNLIPTSKFSNEPLAPNTTDDVLISGSSLMLLMKKTDETKPVYDNFNNNYLEPFISSKLNSDIKGPIMSVYSRNLVYIGVHPKSNSNVLGNYVQSHDKLAGIVLNSSMIDINIITGECNEPDTSSLVIYQQLIRFVVDNNFQDFKTNDDLNTKIISYLISLYKKVLELSNLNDKQEELLAIIFTIIYYKHYIGLDHKSAGLKLAGGKFSDLKTTLADPILVKANNMSNLVNVLLDYRLIPAAQSPNAITFKLLTKLKIIPYLSIMANLGYLISSIILSNQNLVHFQSLKISSGLQNSIESAIRPYFASVKYDANAISKVKSL